jgi:hypothetical protein
MPRAGGMVCFVLRSACVLHTMCSTHYGSGSSGLPGPGLQQHCLNRMLPYTKTGVAELKPLNPKRCVACAVPMLDCASCRSLAATSP